MKSVILSLCLMAVFTGCGKEEPSLQFSAGLTDSDCKQVNLCTYPDPVPTGYQCRAKHYYAGTHGLPDSFEGFPCLVVMADSEPDPSCDSENPNQVCMGWGEPAHPCCRMHWGPGPDPLSAVKTE